ncbi:putative lipid-transfer protein DIR1 [Prosopis cineraria]|uniref:putative lipid-transfer protein DIR1 n=1 Tax=Prosopis cineraria TaxID=364024 RepID=UPI00240F24DE|nr:putative lipid-transfer protein DIR1 [Prosopis cineraria]
MAGLNEKLVVVGVFLAMAIVGSETLVASGEGVLCGMSTQGLMDCRPSVSGQQPQVPPTSDCCSALSGADLKCLCRLKNSKTLLTFYNIDPKQATALPAQCKVVDPVWHC